MQKMSSLSLSLPRENSTRRAFIRRIFPSGEDKWEEKILIM